MRETSIFKIASLSTADLIHYQVCIGLNNDRILAVRSISNNSFADSDSVEGNSMHSHNTCWVWRSNIKEQEWGKRLVMEKPYICNTNTNWFQNQFRIFIPGNDIKRCESIANLNSFIKKILISFTWCMRQILLIGIQILDNWDRVSFNALFSVPKPYTVFLTVHFFL